MWWDSNAGRCGTGSCVSAITDLPNPLIWYAAVAASIYLVVRFVRRREWQDLVGANRFHPGPGAAVPASPSAAAAG